MEQGSSELLQKAIAEGCGESKKRKLDWQVKHTIKGGLLGVA